MQFLYHIFLLRAGVHKTAAPMRHFNRTPMLLCNPVRRGRARRTPATATSTAARRRCSSSSRLRAGYAVFTVAGLLHGRIRGGEAFKPSAYHYRLWGHPKPAKILDVFELLGATRRVVVGRMRRPPPQHARQRRLWWSGGAECSSSSSALPGWRLLDGDLCTSLEELVSQGTVAKKAVCSSTSGVCVCG